MVLQRPFDINPVKTGLPSLGLIASRFSSINRREPTGPSGDGMIEAEIITARRLTPKSHFP